MNRSSIDQQRASVGHGEHRAVLELKTTFLDMSMSSSIDRSVIGPLFEVPLMLSLVRLVLHTCGYFPRNRQETKKMESKKE